MKKDAARDAVVQEARELLVAMEAALLQIEMEGPSKDAINAIFRAAHTIKGSAGLFAFDNIVQFTHVVEHVLDMVRNERLPLDGHLMSVLLRCGDYIGELVDAIERREEEHEPNQAQRAELEATLNGLLSQDENSVKVPEAGAIDPVSGSQQAAAVAIASADIPDGLSAPSSNPYWHLSLAFNENVLRDGLDPISFLHYLRTLGRIETILTVQNMPAAQEMNAETCYLGFEISLTSESTLKTLESVFEFVREDSHILILPPASSLAAYGALLQRLDYADAVALGQTWMSSGALSAEEWQHIAHFAAIAERAGDVTDKQAIDIDTAINTRVVKEALQEVVQTLQTQPAMPEHRSRSLDDRRAQEQKFIKIEVSKLDQLIDLVGELVIAGAGARLIARQRKDNQFEEATHNINLLMEQIRDAALTLRMVQVNEVFQRFPRVVRDIARDLDKDIELVMTGAETELDKSMIDRITDPLMHIVRNAIDHGIEPEAERAAAGKSPQATLRLNATHESGSVVIEVMDDGRGMDRDRILATAIKRGLTTPDVDHSDAEIYRFIFEPGFSTAKQVTSLSGRGVGMDVVRRNIEALHGEVDIETVFGQGTVVRVRLPLTLAIISGFQVVVGNAVFVIPLDMVVECIDMPANHTNNIVSVRDEPLPFVRLRELFELPELGSRRKSLVIVQYGPYRAGLLVDGLMGECQAVIKPLGQLFGKVKGLSGSTILGDGRVALILDVPHLVQYTQRQEQHQLMHERDVAAEP